MKILIVVSAYGLGHLSRQIALKNALLSLDPELTITMVITEQQDNLMRRAILTSERVSIEHIPFTPKITMDGWLKIDKEATKESYLRFWEWETNVRDDMEWGRILQNVDLVINDIESIHNPIVKKMRIPIINISNFTWSDILLSLGYSELADNYASWEKLANYHLQLPNHTKCMGMENQQQVGYLIRELNYDHIEQIRSSSSKPLVLIGYSRKDWEINMMDFAKELINAGYKPIIHERFYNDEDGLDTEPILIRSDDPSTQDYYAAADLVVSKVGYGVVSETLINGTPLLFWIRQDYLEDKIFSDYLTTTGHGKQIDGDITPQELVELIPQWVEKQFEPIQSSNIEIAQLVLQLYHDHAKKDTQ